MSLPLWSLVQNPWAYVFVTALCQVLQVVLIPRDDKVEYMEGELRANPNLYSYPLLPRSGSESQASSTRSCS